MRALSWLLASLALGCAAPPGEERFVEVRPGVLVSEVDVEGTLRAVDSSSMGPPGIPRVWNYKIAMLHAEGEEVKKDTPVLAFDTSELKPRLEQKQAERDSAIKELEMRLSAIRVANHDASLELATARGELRKAALKADVPADLEASYELKKLILDRELAAKNVEHLESRRAATNRSNASEVARLESIRDRAEARVKEIEDAISKMTLLAPRDGTVIYETNWRGEKKKPGDSAWRGETVLRIVSLVEMEAQGEVDEVDANRVAVDQPVSLRLDAGPDAELRGRIRRVADTVSRKSPDNPLKVIRLDITLEPNDEQRLRPGMRFRGKAETGRVEDVLLVPLDVIDATPQGPVAYRRAGSDVEAVLVELGRRDADEVEIVSGLEEGDEVLRFDAVASPGKS